MKEQVERITYETEWLDNVIQKCKYAMEELKKETFKSYREIGKIILESGYKKGTWHDEHKQKFMDELGIKNATFGNILQLAEMEEEKFLATLESYPSYHNWTHRGSIAKKQKHEREIQILKQATKYLPAPQKQYDVIVVDPPWPYETHYDPETRRGACPYPEMPIEEIRSIELPNTENCVLWLWTTNAFMHEAYHILDAWGFQPKTIVTWVKNRFGVGYWLRGQTEHCILAIKGEPTYNVDEAKSLSTVLIADVTEHSEKPRAFYELVDKVCVGWKLDYFSREKRQGWDSFGTMEKETNGNGLHE